MAKITLIACMLVVACHHVASVASEEQSSALHRVRRQSALDLSLNHRDRYGNPRPVGKLHGYVGADVRGNDRRNFNANLGAGLGSVLYRSGNGRHSVGVGATIDQNRGRYGGFTYRTKPNYGVGVGYKYRFG